MRSLTPRVSLILICLVTTSLGLDSLVKADDLFSRKGLDSVFGAPSAPAQPTQPVQPAVPRQPVQPQAPRFVAKEQLAAFLQAAGYQPKREAENLYSIDLKKEKWTFPVAFAISPNNKNLWIYVLLNTVDERSVSPNTLLGLMEANNTYGPAHFTYNSKSKRIDLNRALNNENLAPADLSNSVNLLIEIAVRTSKLWTNPQSNVQQQPVQPTQPVAPTKPAPSTPYWQTPAQPPQQQQQQAPTQGNLIGIWGAQPTEGTVFGLRFDADGTFVLYHKNQAGKESKSKGRYTLQNGTLTLVSDDGNLSGTFVWKDNQTFVFTPSTSGANLVFTRIED